jgi:threonine synthase
MKMAKEGTLHEGDSVVCTLTGHGLKDPDTAMSISHLPPPIPPTREAVARLMRL